LSKPGDHETVAGRRQRRCVEGDTFGVGAAKATNASTKPAAGWTGSGK
jgi:hypothetical protein